MARGPAPIPVVSPGSQGHVLAHNDLIKQIHELQDASARQDETIAAMFSMLHDCVSLLQELTQPRGQKLTVAKPNVQVQFGEAMAPTVDEVAKRMKQVLDAMKRSELGRDIG